MDSNPINFRYISEGVSAQSAFQQPLVGPVSTGQPSLQTGTVLHGHSTPPGFNHHYNGIHAPYGTPYSAQYPPQSAIPNPWGVTRGVSIEPEYNNTNMLVGSSSTTQGGYLPSTIYGLMSTGKTVSMATDTSYTGIFSQAQDGSIPSSVQGLMMPYQTASSLSGFPSQAPSSFQPSVSQASVLPTTSVPIPQRGYILFNGQSTMVNIVPSTTNVPIPQGGYVSFNGQDMNVNTVPSINSAPILQGSYKWMSGHSTNLNLVSTTYTNSTPIPQGGYLPISGQGTNVNNVPPTNNASMLQGGCAPISGQDTNANMVPLTNIAPVPHGGSVPFSGQGTNSDLVTFTTPQAGYISSSNQGVDLKIMSQTLYPPVQSSQNSNTSNQYLPCTPNQAMQYSTKQQVLTHNHIQPPPGFQQLQPQHVPQQRYAPTLPTQNQLTQQIYGPTLPAQNQLTQQVYSQALPTQINIQQQQQCNLATQLHQNTTPPQQYTIQQNMQNAYHVGQVHQQTMMINVPYQILQDVPCQIPCVAPDPGGLTDQVSPTLLQGSNVPPPGAVLTDMGSIQYQVNPAKLQGGYVPLMASASTESIPGNVEKISKTQMPCYNSESVQTVGVLKPLAVEVSDQGSCSLFGNILDTAMASVCSDHAHSTQPHGSKQTLMLLQQCGQQHLQSVHAPLLALRLPSKHHMAQSRHQQIIPPSPQQQLMCSQEQHSQQVTLTTIMQQYALVFPQQHLSTQQLSPDYTDTKSSEDDGKGVCNEHEMLDLAEALTDEREHPGVFDTPEKDALLRTVKRHHVDVYQRLFILKNHVDSLVTDMQTIMKEMRAIDLEQNDQIYDC